VTKMVLGLWRQAEQHNQTATPESTWSMSIIERVNGLTAVAAWQGTNLESLFTFVEDQKQRIVAIDVIRNPDKLAYLKRELAPATAPSTSPAADTTRRPSP
jgi:hypothetical protein